jgi:ribosomal protein L37AE/L43A
MEDIITIGTEIPKEIIITCPYCGAEIHTWTGTGSVYCYNCGMTF